MLTSTPKVQKRPPHQKKKKVRKKSPNSTYKLKKWDKIVKKILKKFRKIRIFANYIYTMFHKQYSFYPFLFIHLGNFSNPTLICFIFFVQFYSSKNSYYALTFKDVDIIKASKSGKNK